jgi:hypothetical protein
MAMFRQPLQRHDRPARCPCPCGSALLFDAISQKTGSQTAPVYTYA